ncbi:MAG TPA: AAA family ATPase, partial [Firmicutes bacterium]|nr:AAA family ATPase [Bacillota bacterium]
MKPIKLKIEGLQSFREAQVIDFEALTSAGVFGIFGPTGSGKSTILDAITLALYGRVERAHKKNNRGILNLERNRLHVEFTFQLGEGDGKRRIRIERSYISRGDNSLHTSTCR